METSHERRVFILAFLALFGCLLIQMWWLFSPPPAIVTQRGIEQEVAAVSKSTLNVFIKTDNVTGFLSQLPVISNLGGGR
jgi:uncharacterized protein (DUF58 family)